MKLLSSIRRWVTAKSDEYSENIEKGNEIQFARQDLTGMREDLSQITQNLGTIKATALRLRREKAEFLAAKEQHEHNAIALMQAGKEGLAQRHAEKIALLEENITTLNDSLVQQDALMKTQQKQRANFTRTIAEAENSLRLMESMDSVAKATEKITQVKIPGNSNALASFKERQRRIQTRLDQAQALQEETDLSSEESLLANETTKALGDNKGNEVLARLRMQSQLQLEQK